jgi:hypothetical protein
MDSGSDETDLTLKSVEENSVEFILFPKLPLELRRKIWKAACFMPRIIDLVSSFNALTQAMSIIKKTNANYSILQWARPAPRLDQILFGLNCPNVYLSHCRIPPALLHVSREAREEGLKHYTLGFGTTRTKKMRKATLNFDSPAQIYVNWKCDIICPIFDFDLEARDAMREDLRKEPNMRCIAVDEEESLLARVLMKQALLDEIILYPKPGYFHRFDINRPIKSKFSPLDLGKKGATTKIKSVGNQHPIRAKRRLLGLKRESTNSMDTPQAEETAAQGSQTRPIRPKVTTMLLEIEV